MHQYSLTSSAETLMLKTLQLIDWRAGLEEFLLSKLKRKCSEDPGQLSNKPLKIARRDCQLNLPEKKAKRKMGQAALAEVKSAKKRNLRGLLMKMQKRNLRKKVRLRLDPIRGHRLISTKMKKRSRIKSSQVENNRTLKISRKAMANSLKTLL